MASPNPRVQLILSDFFGAAPQFASDPEEDEEEDDDEDEEEDEEGDEEEEEDEDYVAEDESVRVTRSGGEAAGEAAFENGVEEEEAGNKRRRIEAGEALSLSGVGTETGSGSQGSDCKWSQIDGLFCPICMEAWTDDGDHHIWCEFIRFFFVISSILLSAMLVW